MRKLKAICAIALASLMLAACGGAGASGNNENVIAEESGKAGSTYQLFPEFETVDLDGNQVDGSIFTEKDLTVVNIWGICKKTCLMEVDPVKCPDSAECIRCGACAHACPKKAIHLGFKS